MAGLLGALKQYLRDAGPGGVLNPEVTRQGLLDSAAFATMPVPLLGDAVGLAADANRFATDPSERTPLNFGLSALGLLPFIPGMTIGRRAKEVAEADKLIGVHNLSADNLRHAERLGGLPVPSIGISKAASPLEGFGEISLVAPQGLLSPGRGNPVFAADAYSPRYPTISYKPDSKSLKRLNEKLAAFQDGRQIYGSDITSVDDLVSNPSFRKYADATIGPTGDYHAKKALAEGLLKEAGVEEKIFKGYTYNGNRRYSDHTLENVVKEMKSRGVKDEEGFNYGINSMRAAVTPKFSSMSGIKNARDKIRPVEEVEASKEALTKEFFDLAEKFRPYANNGNEFGFADALGSNLKDWANGRVRLKEFYPGLPEDVYPEARKFIEKLRNAPVGYFEAKPQRAVGINEFAGAIVPNDVSEEVLGLLGRHGITDIQRYGTPEEKAAAAFKFKQHLFQLGIPVGIGGGLLYSQDESSYQ